MLGNANGERALLKEGPPQLYLRQVLISVMPHSCCVTTSTYPTHKVPVENFLCIWRTHYLAEFLVGIQAFHFFPLDAWWVSCNVCWVSPGKKFKIIFYQCCPSERPHSKVLHQKNPHWPKPGQAYFRENAPLGWHYCESNFMFLSSREQSELRPSF